MDFCVFGWERAGECVEGGGIMYLKRLDYEHPERSKSEIKRKTNEQQRTKIEISSLFIYFPLLLSLRLSLSLYLSLE